MLNRPRLSVSLRFAAVTISAAACSSTARTTQTSVEPPTSALAEARAYELGNHGPRDYRRAAEIYQQACKADIGIGCRKYGESLLNGRGNAPDLEAALQAFHRGCELTDTVACLVEADIIATREWNEANSGDMATSDERSRAATARATARGAELQPQAKVACEQGELIACEALPCDACNNDGSSGEAARDAVYRTWCSRGVAGACQAIIQQRCESGNDVCLAPLLADKAINGGVGRVIETCKLGDADSCAVLPGRAIALRDLCAAHDVAACAKEQRNGATP